jgi:hypothetical protein
MQENTSSRKPLLLLLFHLLHLHRCHASCRHDNPNQQTQRSKQFGVEAAKTTARKLATMVGGHTPETLNCELIVDPEVMQLINWQF